MHITKGKTLAQSISDRTDYGLNPEKTNDGELTSAYACDPRSFAAEVLYYTSKAPLLQATRVNITFFEPFFYKTTLAPLWNEG